MRFRNSKDVGLSLLALALSFKPVQPIEAKEVEPLNQAISGSLGTTKATRKSIEFDKAKTDVFSPKEKSDVIVLVEKAIWNNDKNCTHTWTVALQPSTAKVKEVRVVEYGCSHAGKIAEKSFLAQFEGVGPANLETLDSVDTRVGATDSCKMTAEAVKRAIRITEKIKSGAIRL